jgi:hypothetical protein
MTLSRMNLFFGLALFVAFLATGFYMGEYFKPSHLDDLQMRLQIRSSHIYILFISLLNILAFKVVLKEENLFSNFINSTFRILLVAAGIFSLFAFAYEHTGVISERILTLVTVIVSLTSVGLIILNELATMIKVKMDKS